jgi:HEAT repeat protein
VGGIGAFIEPAVFLFPLAIAAVVAVGAHRTKRKQWRTLLAGLGEYFSLRLVDGRGINQHAYLVGTRDGFKVQMSKSGTGIQVTIEGEALRALEGLSFTREVPSIFFSGRAPDPQVGDVVFDRAVRLDLSDIDKGFALLSSELRWKLERVTSAGGSLRGGRLTVKTRPLGESETFMSLSFDEITGLVETGLTVAKLLKAAHENPIGTLLTTAKSDPNPGIRLQAVCLLDQLHGETDAARAALQELQTDPDMAVRLEACLRGSPRNYDVVRRVIRDSSAPVPVRVRAIEELPQDDLGRLRNVDRAMLTERAEVEAFEVLEAILQKFLRSEHKPEFTLLQGAVKRSTDRGRLAAVRLAGQQTTPHFEWLVGLLDPRYPISSVGVAQALGASGNPKATLHLEGILADRESTDELKRAARAALNRLRAKLDHHGGGLSVFEEGDGRVSLVEAGEGALSRPTRGPQKQKN